MSINFCCISAGTFSYEENSMLNIALPELKVLSAVMYPNCSANGTLAFNTLCIPLVSIPSITALLLLRSALISPRYSSGVKISTFIIGSSKTVLSIRDASLKHKPAAILNESSSLSTGWNEPSISSTFML